MFLEASQSDSAPVVFPIQVHNGWKTNQPFSIYMAKQLTTKSSPIEVHLFPNIDSFQGTAKESHGKANGSVNTGLKR